MTNKGVVAARVAYTTRFGSLKPTKSATAKQTSPTAHTANTKPDAARPPDLTPITTAKPAAPKYSPLADTDFHNDHSGRKLYPLWQQRHPCGDPQSALPEVTGPTGKQGTLSLPP